jgi:cupin fold WbuC family metalloprotein
MEKVNIKTIRLQDLKNLCIDSMHSVRKRSHLNIHKHYSDPAQQIFIAMQPESYIRPHRHRIDGENLLAVAGHFEYIQFNDQGEIENRIHFGNNGCQNLMISVSRMRWHTVICLQKNGILFEVKNGPFDPLAAKEFANWAPEENSIAAVQYLAHLKDGNIH